MASKKTFKWYLTRGDTQIHTHTDGHRDSMTESAQWADSVKHSYSKKGCPDFIPKHANGIKKKNAQPTNTQDR